MEGEACIPSSSIRLHIHAHANGENLSHPHCRPSDSTCKRRKPIESSLDTGELRTRTDESSHVRPFMTPHGCGGRILGSHRIVDVAGIDMWTVTRGMSRR